MPNKYQVKIEDSILPQLYTFDQLIDAGLLDDVDEKIKVRLNGDSAWVTARSFPFSDLESRQSPRSVSVNERKRATPAHERTTTINVDTVQQSRNLPSISNISQLQQEYPPVTEAWNWGAFSLSWIWGVFNGLYWPLIIIVINYIPYVGVIISLCTCLLLGKNGNLYAWRKAKHKGFSVEHFTYIQSKWNTAGQIVTIIFLFLLLVLLIIYAL